ncbi:ketopantoate reductase PanE/ApbA C terminal-domain-containing protein [Bombardia bombarda]|uniref:Ketopantoate reductase PanE/ApbA C terminal-domain-containing protein n=1 Tax=Bombardia bombarda TaxID=252184 RepID=A0AA39XNN0_9PEZI|nr:ketopantoate reductase PanE/ApbA C terminal-domain-containing protein [Bombardia bombarda]
MSALKRLVSRPVSQPKAPVPTWLQSLTKNQSAGPTLYAWTTQNLTGNRSSAAQGAKSSSSSHNRHRIHILGIGNLGRLYATSLAELAEAPITLVVHRKSLLEQWMSDPAVEIVRQGVSERLSDFEVEWWAEERPDIGPIREVCDGTKLSNLIIATKAPDALPQSDRLRRYLDSSSTVAFVQNGMSKLWPPHGAQYSATQFPPNQHPNWIVCVTTHGVTSLGPFRSIHASPADVAIGPVLLNLQTQAKAGYLTDQIVRAPHLSAQEFPTPALWILQLEKLVVNSIINPLTAILRCKNGLLFSRIGGDVEKVMDLLLAEASHVLQALAQDESTRTILDIKDPPTASLDAEKNDQALLERFSESRLRTMLWRVGEKVKDNTSSMLQDVTSGKQTEIREFNGWLVETAEYLGIEAENHKIICEMVERGQTLEESQLGRYFPAIN